MQFSFAWSVFRIAGLAIVELEIVSNRLRAEISPSC
jgi:hypothetical protein